MMRLLHTGRSWDGTLNRRVTNELRKPDASGVRRHERRDAAHKQRYVMGLLGRVAVGLPLLYWLGSLHQ